MVIANRWLDYGRMDHHARLIITPIPLIPCRRQTEFKGNLESSSRASLIFQQLSTFPHMGELR